MKPLPCPHCGVELEESGDDPKWTGLAGPVTGWRHPKDDCLNSGLSFRKESFDRLAKWNKRSDHRLAKNCRHYSENGPDYQNQFDCHMNQSTEDLQCPCNAYHKKDEYVACQRCTHQGKEDQTCLECENGSKFEDLSKGRKNE